MTKTHPFLRTLGTGPYKIVDFFALVIPSEANHGRNNYDMAPKNLKKGVGTCAHCGHGIINNYIVQNGIGERFPVGSECVEKTSSSGDIQNLSGFQKHQKEMKRKAGQERRERQRLKLKEECEKLVKDNEYKLAALPHPIKNDYCKDLSAYAYCSNYLQAGHTLNGYKIFKQKLLDWVK